MKQFGKKPQRSIGWKKVVYVAVVHTSRITRFCPVRKRILVNPRASHFLFVRNQGEFVLASAIQDWIRRFVSADRQAEAIAELARCRRFSFFEDEIEKMRSERKDRRDSKKALSKNRLRFQARHQALMAVRKTVSTAGSVQKHEDCPREYMGPDPKRIAGEWNPGETIEIPNEDAPFWIPGKGKMLRR